MRAQVRLLRLEVDRAPGRRDSLLRTSPLHKPAQAEIHGAALDIAGERLAQHGSASPIRPASKSSFAR